MVEDVRHELRSRFVLFSFEGTAEQIIIERLFEDDLLCISRDRVVKDPMTFKPGTRSRKARDIEERFLGENYAVRGSEGLLVARIVDSRSARFRFSKRYEGTAVVRSFFTRPEIEMLAIIHEDAYGSWLNAVKRNHNLRPSDYFSQNLGLRGIKRAEVLRDYWSDGLELARCIREYSSKKGKSRGDELMLADLLA